MLVLSESWGKLFNKLLLIFSLVLVFSGFMDIFLHFYKGFMVPSWTIGTVSLICGVVFLFIVRKRIK